MRNAIVKKDVIEFLREEIKAAKQNSKDMKSRESKEYFNGLADEGKRTKDFIENMCKVYKIF